MVFRYRKGFLFCRICAKHYREETCPWFDSPGKAGMRYRVCPTKEHNYHLRVTAHNKNSKKYYLAVIKPKLEKEREIVIRWKQQQKNRTKNGNIINRK